jgi:hypothetical protein
VQIGADGKPGKMVDMKFGNDPMKPKARDDYQRIAEKHTGSKKSFEEFRIDGDEGRCTCDEGDPPPALPVASAEQEEGVFASYKRAVESATGLKVAGGTLVAIFIVSELTRLFPARNAVPFP